MEIECTQRLDCTQDQHTQSEKVEPEQIGFLGICGEKYPVKRGPNKIGRDPQTCRIVLNLNSISRQHAVINILNLKEFMVMDLDSANQTKVQGKTLQPYIPHPLQNGDMVQFGDVFGVFRLLEDDNGLPMTQAIDVPCTPAPTKQMSRCGAPSVLVPESPEVSDKDDSFIMPSQPKTSSEFKSPMNKFLKPSNKTVAIQPMGSRKIDNAYWQSGKKSESFNFHLDDSGSSLNDSTTSNRSNKVVNESTENIHEMETQVPYKADDSADFIYTANTQLPPTPSIHVMETQQPLPDIHGVETQQPVDIHALDTQNIPENIYECATQVPTDVLPEVCKVDVEENVQFDLFTANKENDNSIFNAETQVFPITKETIPNEPMKPEGLNVNVQVTLKEKNDSDEEIVFDEVNSQSFQEEFESQPLLPADVSPQIEKIEKIEVSSKSITNKSGSPSNCDDFDILPTQKITTDIDTLPTQKSISNCDDFDILPTQKITTDIDTLPTQKKRNDSGSSTDCEDFDILPSQKLSTDIDMLPTQKITNDIEILPTQKITIDDDDDLTDCEDDFASNDIKEPKKSPEVDFEDMATQVLGEEEIEAELNQNKDQIDGPTRYINFEDMPTQIITDDSKEENFEDMPTQIIIDDEDQDDAVKINQEVYSEEIVVSPFKVPLPTPLKAKKISKLALTKTSTPNEKRKVDEDDPNYYAATQDIFNDLCSQKQDSPNLSKPVEVLDDEDLVPSSVKDNQMGDRFRHVESELSPVKKSRSSTPKRNTKELVNKQVAKVAQPTDVDFKLKTPKTLKIINADLPDSQEIKTSVTLKHKSITESSSDTEAEEVSDQNSGTSIGKKRRTKINAKLDLTKRFEESLPTRIITRVRKPTYKIKNSDDNSKNHCKSILKNSLFDSEDSIDAEIISENISRLKSKSDKKKDKEKGNSKKQSDEPKKRPESRNDNKNTDKSIEDSNKHSGTRNSRSKSKKSEETKSKTEKRDDSKDKKTVRSTRSSRNKKENDDKDSKSKSDKDNKKSKEKDRSDSKSRSRTRNDTKEAKTTRDSKSKDKNNKELEKHESSPEMVRRSKRQKTKENNKEMKHENSTVYLSSESSTESPKTLKRPAAKELEVPSPKRTRSWPSSKTSSVSTTPSSRSVCSTPVRSEKHYVLFTAFSNDDVRSKLEDLGAVIVTDVMACTVLVTLQIKRTFKLLCAVGLGRPIVGPDWVQACADTNTIVDPWLYIIKDTAAEKRFQFSLEAALRGPRNFLRGYCVSATPSVLPNAQEMKLIVECSGGSWRGRAEPPPPAWVCVCVTSGADRGLWGALRRAGAQLVSTEFILGGVLRQRADVAATLYGNATKKKKGDTVGEFVCEQCGRRCLSRIGLSSHARSHTRT